MKFDKIVYIRYIPLTEKIFEDHYMQQVADIGLQLEYWDISNLFFASTAGQEDSSHLCKTLHFGNYSELEYTIGNTDAKRTLFIVLMSFNGGQRKLYRLFTKYDCKYSIFGRNMFPVYTTQNKSHFQRLLGITPSSLVNYIRNKYLQREMRCGKIKGFETLFLGGKNGWQGIGNIDYDLIRNTPAVKVNSNDYDCYLSLKDDKSRVIEGDYILFLDEYLPLHPDTELLGLNTIGIEEYYPALNAYFDRVEAQFGMPVVIAAHPKALRYKTDDFFCGRAVYFGMSAELSKDAFFVMAHDSTSVNYPVAFGKRVHFLTSGILARKRDDIHLHVLNIARYLGSNVQYFDRPDDPINVVAEIDAPCYAAYKEDYQTWPETENILSETIFTAYLKE